MMQTVRPTKKQRVLLDYIEKFIVKHGYSPSYREIMNGCSYNSIATVAVHINNLISRGHLRKRDHSARSLELTVGPSDNLADSPVDLDKAAGKGINGHGPDWLVEQTEAMFRQAEISHGGADISAKAQQAYNNVQVLMATLKILQIDQLGESDGRHFTARLQTLKSAMQAEAQTPKPTNPSRIERQGVAA